MGMILAIDDDRNLLKILNQQVQKMGHKLVAASSGQEGLELIRSGNPDVILLDIMMPGINGFDVIRKMRQDENTRRIPILMVTSKKDKDDVVTAMKLGVMDYIVKPYTFDKLHGKIEAALRQSQIQHEIEAGSTNIVVVSRTSGITTVSLRDRPASRTVLEEVRRFLNPSLLTMARKDTLVLDLRLVPEFAEADVKPLDAILKLFAPARINIIAGKHYGDLVTLSDFETDHNLFITMGDFEEFMQKK